MGLEYRLEPSSGTAATWSASLEELVGVEAPIGELVEWRAPGAQGFPDAFMRVAPEHIYFCVNTAPGEVVLTRVRQVIERDYGLEALTEL